MLHLWHLSSSPNTRPILVIAAILGVSLAACSDSRESSEESAVAESSAPSMDVCELLTAEEIEDALSQQPGDPTAGTIEPGTPSCVWPSADGSNPRLVHLIVGARTAETYDEYVDKARHAMGDHFQAHNLEKVEGIGDFAVFATFGQMGLLQVFTGDHLVQVSAGPGAHRSAQQNCTTLARAALSRIG